jgi:hypothetical protein
MSASVYAPCSNESPCFCVDGSPSKRITCPCTFTRLICGDPGSVQIRSQEAVRIVNETPGAKAGAAAASAAAQATGAIHRTWRRAVRVRAWKAWGVPLVTRTDPADLPGSVESTSSGRSGKIGCLDCGLPASSSGAWRIRAAHAWR